jgi:hypothetical protein
MRRIVEHSSSLRWFQPSALRMEYELSSGNELVGTLKLRGLLGTLATAESGDGSWTFKRVGFWQNRATIRERGSEAELAVFRNNTWAAGGELEFVGGPLYKATTNFWMTRFEFCTPSEVALVRFRYGGFLRRSADVEVTAPATDLAQLPLLVLFGWYLMVMLDRDAGAVAIT